MSAAGAWEEVVPDALRPAQAHCELCGRLLVRRRWVVSGPEGERRFCEPDCADLHEHYWLPRYGRPPA